MTKPALQAQQTESHTRLARLLKYLSTDPDNLSLLSDVAVTARAAGDPKTALSAISRYERLAALPALLLRIKGQSALECGAFTVARDAVTSLRQQGEDSPTIRYELAVAEAGLGAYEAANELLDDETLSSSDYAPALKVRVLHHLSRYDEAIASGERLSQQYPQNAALMGALATLALDVRDRDLARRYSELAGDNSEGLTTRGYLALETHDSISAQRLFESAIAVDPKNPRAWIGKGLSLLVARQTASAAEAIEKGCNLFDNHVGSWIAAGWVHFANGALGKSRTAFDRAIAIDANFSECHGGLAVIDFLEGKTDSAKRRIDTALRLDRTCFGAAVAKSLMLQSAGRAEAAQKVREIALATPIGSEGRTIAEELVAFGFGGRR